MYNERTKLKNNKRIISCFITTVIALITYWSLSKTTGAAAYYTAYFIFITALISIGYFASNISDVLLSAVIFVFFGPIIRIFKSITIIDSVYRFRNFFTNTIYVLMLMAIPLMAYFIKVIIKNKDKIKEYIIHTIALVIGIDFLEMIYYIFMFLIDIIIGKSSVSLGSYLKNYFNYYFKFSFLLIIFIAILISIYQAILSNKKIDEMIISNETNNYTGLICNYCKSPISSGSKFCRVCGTKVDNDEMQTYNIAEGEMLCENCHKTIKRESKFCMYCGKKLDLH